MQYQIQYLTIQQCSIHNTAILVSQCWHKKFSLCHADSTIKYYKYSCSLYRVFQTTNCFISAGIVSDLCVRPNYNFQHKGLIQVITFIYFLVIAIWRPYHQLINIHNRFLVFNHASLLVILVICEVFAKVNKLPSTFYIVSMYLTMVLLSLIMIGGFVRIFLQNNFRKSLERNSSLLKQIIDPQNNEVQNSQKDNKNDTVQVLPKKFGLIANNPYVFRNQLKAISKAYGLGNYNQQPGKKTPQKILSLQEQIYIIDKLRQQFKKKRQQNFVNDILQNQKSKISPQKIHHETFFEANTFLNDFNLNDQIENHQLVGTSKVKKRQRDASTESQQINRLKEIKAKLRSQLNYMFN